MHRLLTTFLVAVMLLVGITLSANEAEAHERFTTHPWGISYIRTTTCVGGVIYQNRVERWSWWNSNTGVWVYDHSHFYQVPTPFRC